MKMIIRKFVLVAALFAAFSSLAFSQVYGVVNVAVNFEREAPDYAAELGNQALMGTVVTVLGRSGYWLQVRSPEPYTAWVNEMTVTLMDREEIDEYIAAPKYIVTAEYSNIYSSPSEKSERVSDLVMGDILRIWTAGKHNRVVTSKGFVGVVTPSGKPGYVRAKDVEDFTRWADTRKPTAENIIATAKKMLGVCYQWGGTSIKGVDCSGLTRTAFFMNGLLLPRNTSQQVRIGDEVDFSGVLRGDFDALLPGDLILFGNPMTRRVSHVSIYLGDGKIIHSSQVVRINSLRRDDPDYYDGVQRILAVRRVIGREDSNKGINSIRNSPFYFPGNGHFVLETMAPVRQSTI